MSGSYGNSGGRDDPERLPNDPIWGESLLIRCLTPVLCILISDTVEPVCCMHYSGAFYANKKGCCMQASDSTLQYLSG